jgi:heat shock protein HtpX
MVGFSRGVACLHVTTGLLALLDQSELEAVIAHELAHVAHRDAAVMSAAGGPGAVLYDGARRIARSGWWLCMWSGLLAAGAIGWVSRLGTLALSRRRELAADAGSARLTGRPMALAFALRRISGQLRLVPEDDLRVAARRDMFHLLPVNEIDRFLGGGLTDTHPSLSDRIERLEQLERQMHQARLCPPRLDAISPPRAPRASKAPSAHGVTHLNPGEDWQSTIDRDVLAAVLLFSRARGEHGGSPVGPRH